MNEGSLVLVKVGGLAGVQLGLTGGVERGFVVFGDVEGGGDDIHQGA